MLNQNQAEQLGRVEEILREILRSKEYKALDYHPDLTLGDSLQGVSKLLDEYYQEHEKQEVDLLQQIQSTKADLLPQGFERQQTTTVREQNPDTWRCKVIDGLSVLAIASFLTAIVSSGISLFFAGASDLDKASGNRLRPDFASLSLGYRGLAIAGVGLFITSAVSAGMIANGEKNQ